MGVVALESFAVPMSDADLEVLDMLERFRCNGDVAARDELIARFGHFARTKARGYFLIGGDRDDVEQEAMIGLYKAIRDFRPGRDSGFRAFAELCIKRQIITAIKTATRLKHQPLNSYHSISAEDDSSQPTQAVDAVLARYSVDDPCDHLIADEQLRDWHRSVDELLSPLEIDVLRLYLDGRSYAEIAVLLDRHAKAIDNALQRIKRKLGERHLLADSVAA